MARKLSVEYPDAIYHVMNRGNRREPIFEDDADRQRFLETLDEVCLRTGWAVRAFCLMRNHFHLVVDGSGNGYLRTVCDYVHLIPVRAKLLRPDQALREFAWSSLGEYLKAPSKRAGWMRVDRLFGEMGIPTDSAAGRRRFEAAMEEHRSQEQEGGFEGIRRGWFPADESFRKELLGLMQEKIGVHHYGEERQACAVERAEQIVSEELRRRGLTPDGLSRLPKGNRSKVAIAMRLRAETTMTIKWIAERVHMGSVAYLNNRLYLVRQGKLDK